MSSANSNPLRHVDEQGWRRGFGNLLSGELSGWFQSSRWVKQLVLWMVLVNAMMLIMAFASQQAAGDGPDFLFMYGLFGGMFVAIGVMIVMQRAIVGEKREGTAAWVLSKPVTRSAFVMSRLCGNTLGILVTSTLVPAVLVYLTAGLFTPLGWLSPLGFLAGTAMYTLHLLFWVTLTLMTGVLFESTGAVIAVPMTLFFVLWFLPGLVPVMEQVNPIALTFSEPKIMQAIAVSLMSGTPVATWMPAITTGVLCVAFIAISLWRFNRQEF